MKKFKIKKIGYLVIVATILIACISIFLVEVTSRDFNNISDQYDARTLIFFGKNKVIKAEIGKNKVSVKKNFYTTCTNNLDGFEDQIVIDNTIKTANDNIFSISGYVGAHAENRQFFYLDEESCPKQIAFYKSNQKFYNIFSDQPNFELVYSENGDLKSLIVDFRNYDLDPTKDILRQFYDYDSANHQFNYLKTIESTTVNCQDCQGRII